MACRSVVLPAPFAPMIAVSEPAAKTPDTASTATRSRYPTVSSRNVTHPRLTSLSRGPAACRLLGSLIRSAGPWRLFSDRFSIGRRLLDEPEGRGDGQPGPALGRGAGLGREPAMLGSLEAVAVEGR